MSEVIKRPEALAPELSLSLPAKLAGLWPVLAPIALALVFILTRLKFGEHGFLYDGALTVLALVCYISASVLLVTNLWVKEEVLARFGLWTVMLGYSFNLSGWMIRWIEAGEKEGWIAGKVWRYYPLDNLHALTLGFCCGAALATLIVIRKPKYRLLGALSMPVLSVVLTLGIALGNEIRTLQPILDSYWRPIHVSIATVAYGVALMSFGIAFAYLLKDGLRSEAMAIAVLLFGVLVLCTVNSSPMSGHFEVPGHATYGMSLAIDKTSIPLRATLPGVGPLMVLTLLISLASLALFIMQWQSRDEKQRKLGWRLFYGATILQGLVLGLVSYHIVNANKLPLNIPDRAYNEFAPWLTKQMQQQVAPAQQLRVAQNWVTSQGAGLKISFNSNPVEYGALFGLFVALLMVWLLTRKREEVNNSLPALNSLDGLLYKTVGICIALLTMLLITGAVWANESWGRYWGWDSKETGAFVSWMAYAGYLHTRIAHGWRGRKSAYFAVLGFALVIFTWLGVSYLLPGLHSYAD